MKKFSWLILWNVGVLFSQSQDEQMLKEIYKFSLTNAKCYSLLDNLSSDIGPRLSGFVGAEKAVNHTKSQLENFGCWRTFRFLVFRRWFS